MPLPKACLTWSLFQAFVGFPEQIFLPSRCSKNNISPSTVAAFARANSSLAFSSKYPCKLVRIKPNSKITAGATITTFFGAPNMRIEFFSNDHHEVNQEPTNKAVCSVGIGFGESGSDMENDRSILRIWTCLRALRLKLSCHRDVCCHRNAQKLGEIQKNPRKCMHIWNSVVSKKGDRGAFRVLVAISQAVKLKPLCSLKCESKLTKNWKLTQTQVSDKFSNIAASRWFCRHASFHANPNESSIWDLHTFHQENWRNRFSSPSSTNLM